MTVKDVFDLRRQGKIEEAYEAIRPMYAVHKGHYTTLCMFWTGNDILKKRAKEGRLAEAVKIFEALLRMLPTVEDNDHRAHSSLLFDAVMLSKEVSAFSVLNFLERYGVGNLTDADWQAYTPAATPTLGTAPHTVPSVAHQLLMRAFHEVQQQPTADTALRAMPLLQEAMRRTPHNKNCQRFMALVYRILGQNDKAADIERRLAPKP